MVESGICAARSKALEQRIVMAEKRSDERDEENEKITEGFSASINKCFEGLKLDQDNMKKELKEFKDSTNDNFKTLKEEIPLMVTTALDASIKTGLGRAVIFCFKALLIGGVGGGVIAAISFYVKNFILGGGI